MTKRKVIKPLKQNTTPTHRVDLHLKDRVQWESEIFDDAVYFTVSRKAGPGKINRLQFDNFLDALRNARYDPTAMVYAVASDGAQVCIPQKEKRDYAIKWIAKKGIT